jgi:hypothetical protein
MTAEPGGDWRRAPFREAKFLPVLICGRTMTARSG